MRNLYPMKLKPAYKDYLWGGTKLKDEYGKTTQLHIVAESWEVSCHPDGLSVVINGIYAGVSLWDVLSSNPDFIGTMCNEKSQFPILIKFIDAASDLSLQVHPDDDYAVRCENGQQGKNEMWYIVECEPGAKLILGLKKQLTKQRMRLAIENDTILDYIRAVPVKPGDCYCLPAGTLHAIGKGILIAEVQQNSNLTYRVYDYGRLDTSGNPRKLHIDKAIDVTDAYKKPLKSDFEKQISADYNMEKLSNWDYFDARKYTLHTAMEMIADRKSFHTYICLSGEVIVNSRAESIMLNKGESIYIPAGLGKYTIKGNADLLFTAL